MILLILRWDFLSMMILHLSIPLPVLCGPLLQPQYYPSIIDCLLSDLGQLCFFQLDQTFLIGLVQALLTNGRCITLLYRPLVPPILVILRFVLTPQPLYFRHLLETFWFS